jgi:hypothetical protein
MSDYYVEPLDFDDPEAQNPEPLPKGSEVTVKIRGGQVNTDYGFVNVFLDILGEDWQGNTISGHTLNALRQEDDARRRAMNKRTAKRFCEGFGIDAKTFNTVMQDAFELAENGEDAAEAFEPWVGKEASILSSLDKNGYARIGRYLENKLEANSKKK